MKNNSFPSALPGCPVCACSCVQAGPVVLALAYRPCAIAPPLAASLEAATRDAQAEVLELHPLSRPDAEALLPATLPAQCRDEIWRRAGGNPFYLQQLAGTSGGPAAVA